MASTAKKWGVGCGIGCGFLLLVFGGIGTCGYLGVRHLMDKGETLEASFDTLDAQHGRPAEFVPAADGTIAPERMETFLAVRDDMIAARGEASGAITVLEDDNEGKIAKIQAGIRLIPAMMAFISERNEVLLEQGMGLGEYQYIYAMSYYGHLDKDPADGPSFKLSGPDEEDHQAGPVHWNVERHKEDAEEVRAEREHHARDSLNELFVVIAKNQLDELDAALALSADPDQEIWRETLAAELGMMEREPRRILWEEGLPPQLAASIEPYRDRLDDSYDPLLNVVEMVFVNHE